MINAIHDGSLAKAQYETLPIFNLQYPTAIAGVDPKILDPRKTWASQDEYNHYAKLVAEMFNKNFERFKNDATDEVKRGGPQLWVISVGIWTSYHNS